MSIFKDKKKNEPNKNAEYDSIKNNLTFQI